MLKYCYHNGDSILCQGCSTVLRFVIEYCSIILSNIGPIVLNFMLGATFVFNIHPDLLCNIVPIFIQGYILRGWFPGEDGGETGGCGGDR